MQILRDALYQSKAADSTPYNSGDHVICVSHTLVINLSLPVIDPTGLTSGMNLGSWHLGGKLRDGGICLFPQHLKSGPMTLGTIRKLVDKLLEHGCETCGSVPAHFVDRASNDPGDGILTFNYVHSPFCTENCLTEGLMGNGNKTTAAVPTLNVDQSVSASIPAITAIPLKKEPSNDDASMTDEESDGPSASDQIGSRSWKNTARAIDAEEDDRTLVKRQTRVDKRRASKRNAVHPSFPIDTAKQDTTRSENHATRENAERKRAAAEMTPTMEERELNSRSRSAKFAELAPKRN